MTAVNIKKVRFIQSVRKKHPIGLKTWSKTCNVSGNTFRAFHSEKRNNDEQGFGARFSKHYRTRLISLIDELGNISEKNTINARLEEKEKLAKSIIRSNSPSEAMIVKVIKLLDLSIKGLFLDCNIGKAEGIDVALDKFTLKPIVDLGCPGVEHLSATMGSVRTLDRYRIVQTFIRENIGNSLPLDYEMVHWDLLHLSNLEEAMLAEFIAPVE